VILEAIKGVDGVYDSKWTFTVADNDYRDKDPIKIQANGVYLRTTPIKGYKKKYEFALIFRCAKSGGKLKFTKIVISGDKNQNGKTRLEVRAELYEKYKYLKKSKMRLF